ncbi:hypothetical protein SVI_2714 [Shewanella violacea DSS12]|uniref:Uncharacterized protein n=1 Tax=Shewanella violacea (strain JCM 10179 / CIP 106290 / LMG 19151 / DSS12) TaxID=637905 RepID=D4ZLY6_SHEVD|nr:hypothetical protein SVI_2714 [Shewanella violacea DSS12]
MHHFKAKALILSMSQIEGVNNLLFNMIKIYGTASALL